MALMAIYHHIITVNMLMKTRGVSLTKVNMTLVKLLRQFKELVAFIRLCLLSKSFDNY